MRPSAIRAPSCAWSAPVRSASGLPRSCSSAAEPHGERGAGVGGVLDDREEVLVERQRLPLRAEPVADHRRELGEQLDERAGVAREPQRVGGPRPSRSIDSSPIPSASTPPPIRSAETWRRPPASSAHLRRASRPSSVNASCETRRRPAEDPQRVLAEALRADGARARGARGPRAAEGVDELARREPARHRVDREVAARHVLLDRDGRVGDDLEVAVARARRCARARRRQLDPGGASARIAAVARVEADADELSVHLHVLDPAVRLERRAQAGLIDARDEEVLVGVLDPEQLVAHGAADDVRVEAERADVAADRGRHGCGADMPAGRSEVRDRLDLDERAGGSFATSKVERAGGRSPTRRA